MLNVATQKNALSKMNVSWNTERDSILVIPETYKSSTSGGKGINPLEHQASSSNVSTMQDCKHSSR